MSDSEANSIFAFGVFIAGFIGSLCMFSQCSYYRDQAVDYGCAAYSSDTGEFYWKKKEQEDE